jgi:hypothetical protein
MELAVVMHGGMTTEEFEKDAKDWIDTAKRPKSGELYSELDYHLRLELISYGRSNVTSAPCSRIACDVHGNYHLLPPWT